MNFVEFAFLLVGIGISLIISIYFLKNLIYFAIFFAITILGLFAAIRFDRILKEQKNIVADLVK